MTVSNEVKVPQVVLRTLLEVIKTYRDLQDENEFDPRIRVVTETDEQVIEQAMELSGLKQAAEDLKFLAQHLGHDGEFRKQFTADEHIMARSYCNGFGEFNSRELAQQDFCWDWSHVRDSTPEALAECRQYIERICERFKPSPLEEMASWTSRK